MKLTEQQQKAAYAANSVVVTAGAGTGKTAMLAERFLYHVKRQGFRPIEIVAVTFTEKAAAELRQRIRSTLAENLEDEDLIAEVDAAQISTIHALAARICREFYHLVDIPPDFQLMMETDAAIWLADKVDGAMSDVDEAIIIELGYTWLKEAISQLLLDPHAAWLAISRGEAEWRVAIEAASASAVTSLTRSNAWVEAGQILSRYHGAPGDRLEEYRAAAIDAMTRIEAGELSASTLQVFDRFRTNLGAAANWQEGQTETRRALGDLRDEFREWTPLIRMQFGPLDLIALKRIELLGQAFSVVHEYLLGQKAHDKVLDFIDLEIFARKILEHEQARKHYAKRWRAYLVDEFQDTNPLQAEILKLLRGDAMLTAVGDEKQSIYGFRRADVTVFRSIRESIAATGGGTIDLNETFRSHESLAVKVNETFAPVLGELHQELYANRKEAPCRNVPISIAIVSGAEKESPDAARVVESKYIADEIRRMLADETTVFDKTSGGIRKIKYRDIAILSRTWASIEVYIDALSAAGVPAVNAGGGNLLATREAKDAIAMLAFLADPTDDISLVAVLRSPFFAVSDRTLFRLVGSKQKDQTWWSLLQSGGEEQLGRARETLAKLLAIKNQLLPEQLLREAGGLTGYTAAIANLPQGDRREADWLGVLSLFGQMADSGLGDLLGAVRQARALAEGKAGIPRPPLDAGNAVTLTSIHNAKGLEWPVVFIPDLAVQTGGFGDKLLIESDLGIAFDVEDESSVKAKPAIYELIKNVIKTREREEEKRLLYVAVTRARDRVILTSSGPEKKGTMLELLRPGLEAASIPSVSIPFSADLAIPPTPIEPPQFELPQFQNIDSVNPGVRRISVTGLTDYAVCPLKFHYTYVEGHPGLGEGSGRRRTIGTLTHKALELGLTDVDDLARVADGIPREFLDEAIGLANTFRSDTVFGAFQDSACRREEAVSFEFGGSVLHGVADLVGDDFVLDYKTGAEGDPGAYGIQLWAYLKALNKPKGYVAFLRNPRLYEFSALEIRDAEASAGRLISGIVDGSFNADPSLPKCGQCAFSTICESSATKRSEQITKAAGEQLDLF